MVFVKKLTLVALSLMMVQLPSFGQDKEKSPKKVIARSVQYDVPSGYQQLGTTDLFYCQNYESIDFIGRFNSRYYSSTYADAGYRLAIKVDANYPTSVDCLNGTTVDNVACYVSVVPQGDLGRVIYTVTNSSDSDVVVSLGTHADVMIGSNDSAPISRRMDTLGNTYGLTMKDGGGTQLCVLFGSGLVGVNAVSDFWFGHYTLNRDVSQMIGNYSSGSNYMVENGSYDSGMGWCWKDRTIPANSSVEFSYLIGVGEVNLEPNSSFEVTPDDPEGWNDLSRPHRLTLEGDYESPAGQNGKIEYAVEDSEEWIALTDELESGSSFTATLVAMFNPELSVHTIRFRTVDVVGNTSMLTPITYKDVSFQEIQGIENKVYNWGDSIYQTAISCELMSDQYEIANYRNNVNAGVASFNIEGVFPYTIGRKTYSFTITPLELQGNVEFTNSLSCSYTGSQFTPEWYFTYDRQNELIANQDYNIVWKDNLYPGTATLQVQGINNFIGTLQNTFYIDKAQLRDDLYSLQLPSEDITFDNLSHPASYTKAEGVGDITFYYSSSSLEELSTEAPINIGKYDIYAEIADGRLYYGLPSEKVGTFTIYQFDEADWATIETIVPLLTQKGWQNPWSLSGGISSASSFDGLIIEEGHVVGIDLSNAGLSGSFPIELASFNYIGSINISNNNLEGSLESILALVSQNPLMFAKIKELNISGNLFSGNIGAFAAAFPSLNTLLASSNHISDVFPMIASTVTNLSLDNQTIDRIVEIDLSNLSVDVLAQQIPTILLYDHEGQAYNKPLRLKCTADDGWNVVLTYNDGQINFTDVSEQNAYHGNSGDVLSVVALASNGYSAEAYLSMKLEFSEGDANFNGSVDILDLQSTINYMFGEYTGKPYNFTAANIWPDDIINVQDAVGIVNLLMSNEPNSIAYIQRKARAMLPEGNDVAEANIMLEDGVLAIESSKPIAAFDLAVKGDARISDELSSLGFITNIRSYNGTSRIIGYSLSRVTLPSSIIICSLDNPSSDVIAVKLADRDANEVKSKVSGTITTGIESVKVDNLENCEIYTLDGIRVSDKNLIKGKIYIVKSDKGTQKVIVSQ